MSTVLQVVNEVYSRWLHAGDDQPVTAVLSASLAADGTTVSYSDLTLYPDEENLLAPGVLIEFSDGDQCRITAADYTANTLTVRRGVNGKTATAHSSGDEFIVAPVYDREAVIDAVYDNVVALYPDLYRTTTTTVTTASTYAEVPAGVVNTRSFLLSDGAGGYVPASVILHEDFPPSSTGKAIVFPNISAGYTGYYTWDGRFERPSALADDLADFDVRPEWERIIAVGAAAQVVGNRPVAELTTEFLTEQLQREALPVGAATDVRNGLLTLHRVWLERAAQSQRAERQTAVVYNSVTRTPL